MSAQSENFPQNRPPNPTDANWLLNEFINHTPHLASGGTFLTAPQDKFADSTEDLQRFVDFIKSPANVGRPCPA